MMDWNTLATNAMEGVEISNEQALAVLNASASETPALVAAAYRVRHARFGNRVRLNYLLNAKSGICPEDCNYCSQSKISDAPIEKYSWISPEETLRMADRAVAVRAGRFCMVASGRGPSEREMGQVLQSVRAVRAKYPQLEICACLGLLSDGQAEALKDAGVDAVNHNLNTSQRHYDEICSTHSFGDRVDTVQKVKKAGISACSGALLGMGETLDDIIDVARSLRTLEVESLPINFLMPIQGTPLAKHHELTPTRCLNILALFRFLNPKASLRVSGGRELHLRSLQPLSLYIANSIFIGDYLTTKGQPANADLAMIRDLGFEIEGDVAASDSTPEPVPEVVLKMKTALVTGASRGIGKALALALGKAGFAVAINYQHGKEAAEDVASQLKDAFAVQCDVRDSLRVRQMMESVLQKWKRLDLLINNAGITRDRSILKMTNGEWNDAIDVNLNGAFWCLREAGRVMAEQKSGHILNISSRLAQIPIEGAANYSAAKAGVIALTKAAAREFGRYGVRVNAVFPGFHETDMSARLPEAVRARVKAEQLLGQTTRLGDLTEFVLHLAGNESISGQIFNVDNRLVA